MKKHSRLICGFLAVVMVAATCWAALAAEAPQPLVRVAALKGPTGIGLVKLLEDPDKYAITFAGAPDEIVAQVASGQVDIAAIPTNLAATLYQKTGGGVNLLAVNTLGVLYVLEAGEGVQTLTDLKGKTLLATGQGAMPEYTLNYLLAQAGIAGEVDVQYKAEHAELATLAASGMADLVLLPEPFVTTTLMKNPALRVAIDLTQAFEAASAKAGYEDAKLAMGCMIVRAGFARENPQAVAAFLGDYQASVEFVNGDTQAAGALVAQAGILPSAEVAQKAIPGCHIVLLTGEDMKAAVQPLYGLLYEANPASVGGKLPDDAFYALPQ